MLECLNQLGQAIVLLRKAETAARTAGDVGAADEIGALTDNLGIEWSRLDALHVPDYVHMG